MKLQRYLNRNKKTLKNLGYTTLGIWGLLIIFFALKSPIIQENILKKIDTPDFQFEKVKMTLSLQI